MCIERENLPTEDASKKLGDILIEQRWKMSSLFGLRTGTGIAQENKL
jgi:hypothetical protein